MNTTAVAETDTQPGAEVTEAFTGTGTTQDRYVADVIALHERMNLRGLAGAVAPEHLLHLSRGRDGLTVLAARHQGIPQRYLLGIYGFRLAQYLRLRFADRSLTYDRALFAEPHRGHENNEIHVLAMDERTGAILRYISMVGAPATDPADLLDPRRTPFPCEEAHGINLFDHVEVDPSVTTDQVWEVKRLVHRGPQGGDDAALRLRVTLEMMLGFYTALGRITPQVKVLVGDGEEGVAIQRTLRSLREVTVLEGTNPSLPPDNLMFPLYTQRDVVKAFAAVAPSGAELEALTGRLRAALDHDDLLLGFKSMVAQAGGEVRRVAI